MTAAGALGALLGLASAAGVLLVVRRLPAFRHPTLTARVVPYVPDRGPVLRAAREAATVTPFPTLERIVRPSLARAAGALERMLGGSSSVQRRLDQAGRHDSVQEFRIEQLMWGVAALGAAVVLSVVLLANGAVQSPFALALVCVVAAAVGVVARDHRLSVEVKRREARMLAELPTVADLLALAVTAGEGPATALERVGRACSGELSRELTRALGEARTGSTLVEALEGVARRTGLAALSRFVDGIAIAVDRGTPLAEVLRAQAADVREAGRRALIEAGGRKEIAMMIPVVFLVLPVTVLFALYPGFVNLRLTVP